MSAQTDRFVHDRLPPADQMPTLVLEAPELQFPSQLNLVEELLDKAPAKGWGERPMLRSSRLTLTYAQSRERVDAIVRTLTQDLGLVPGNRVLLRGGNSIGLALAWLAVVKAGLVAVPTMPLASFHSCLVASGRPSPALTQIRSLPTPCWRANGAICR